MRWGASARGKGDERKNARFRIRLRVSVATRARPWRGHRARAIAVIDGDRATGGDALRHSLECVRLAYERTLMAWLRTALLLIAIGFATYKFGAVANLDAGELGAREFGMLMIGGGLATLVLGLLDQRRNLHRLRQQYGPLPYSSAGITAGLIGLLGLVGLLAAVLRQ